MGAIFSSFCTPSSEYLLLCALLALYKYKAIPQRGPVKRVNEGIPPAHRRMIEKYQYAHIHTFGVKIASCFAQIFQRFPKVSSLPELGVNLTGQRAWVTALEQQQGCKQGAESLS